jgi:exopolysaccharide biosynthesis polyprenyl glycosylphosphotransferase
MAQAANIFDVASLRPRLAVTAVPRLVAGTPESARLIPGAGNLLGSAAKKNPDAGVWRGALAQFPSIAARASVRWLPEFFKQFHPALLGTALFDLAVISLVFVLASKALASSLASGHSPQLNPTTLVFFLAVFLLFAIQERMYSNGRKTLWAECRVAAKVILWATLLTALALRCTSPTLAWLPLVFVSGVSGCALCAARRMSLSISGAAASGHNRNVLIAGSGKSGQKTADAIRSDPRSRFVVKGFLAEPHLRGIHGAARLRTIAREECIDEIIVATHDREVAEAVIREARRNQLDVRVVPELFDAEPEALEMENLAGAPLVQIHYQPLPEWTLAVKRIADVVLAAAALVALAPLLFFIAVAIKLDSRGPAFYRGVRVGRKREKFLCCKFRTMIPEADAAKKNLRDRNEREGAFFKIANDPRITRAGWFLRRYSLDELPQLWNVLCGEMSLVGPRPHPPDDVERYSVEHLQRLDFVPGMTGLWQVTARRDRSFEHSVTLDVEYIKSWSLALDLRILWKTIPAVLQGSGA